MGVMEVIAQYFLCFLFYALCGWVLELIVGIIRHGKLEDRGVLGGPICPIYGVGMLIILLLLGNYPLHPVALFLLVALSTATFEYWISVLLEKLFGMRWWDYHRFKFNIEGRTCLESAALFGVLGSLAAYVWQPQMLGWLQKWPSDLLLGVAAVLGGLFLLDCVISLVVVLRLKNKIENRNTDQTAELKAYFWQWMRKKIRFWD